MLVWPRIDWVQVLVTALVPMVLGFVWFMIFQNAWMRAHGFAEADKPRMKKEAPKAYAGSLVSAVLTSYALFVIVRSMGATEWTDGVVLGTLVWSGFVLTLLLSQTLYERRSWAAFLLSNGYQLLSLLVMGAVLAVWR